jgi:hypothetical protein
VSPLLVRGSREVLALRLRCSRELAGRIGRKGTVVRRCELEAEREVVEGGRRRVGLGAEGAGADPGWDVTTGRANLLVISASD